MCNGLWKPFRMVIKVFMQMTIIFGVITNFEVCVYMCAQF